MIILLFKNDETIYLSCNDARKGPNDLTFLRNVGVNHTVTGDCLFMHVLIYAWNPLKKKKGNGTPNSTAFLESAKCVVI